jgi:hypothetical protein
LLLLLLLLNSILRFLSLVYLYSISSKLRSCLGHSGGGERILVAAATTWGNWYAKFFLKNFDSQIYFIRKFVLFVSSKLRLVCSTVLHLVGSQHPPSEEDMVPESFAPPAQDGMSFNYFLLACVYIILYHSCWCLRWQFPACKTQRISACNYMLYLIMWPRFICRSFINLFKFVGLFYLTFHFTD